MYCALVRRDAQYFTTADRKGWLVDGWKSAISNIAGQQMLRQVGKFVLIRSISAHSAIARAQTNPPTRHLCFAAA